MKRLLFAIFAHPDDEANGPAATLMKEVESGAELYIITATAGENGVNAENHPDLEKVRIKEWRAAAGVLGAHEMYLLGYEDGTLCSSFYADITQKLEKIVREACEAQTEAVELAFMTFDPNGLTGHLDHIAMSYITTHVFYKFKKSPPKNSTVKELAYYCFSKQQMPEPKLDYFVFMPSGYPEEYITRRVEVGDLFGKKQQIMHLHKTQAADVEMLLAFGAAFHAVDNFHVIT